MAAIANPLVELNARPKMPAAMSAAVMLAAKLALLGLAATRLGFLLQ